MGRFGSSHGLNERIWPRPFSPAQEAAGDSWFVHWFIGALFVTSGIITARVSLFLYSQISFFYKDTSPTGLEAHPTPCDLIPTRPSVKTLFPE